ncbi:MAG: hypothetical protein U5K70_04225 [Halodesulfurarchaeum sp.]|nr:hypothetical protein [Halodesulfurarchaeum sp.]
MVSRENRVIGGFVFVAIAASFATVEWTDLPTEAGLAVLIFLGVIAPMLVNEFRESA